MLCDMGKQGEMVIRLMSHAQNTNTSYVGACLPTRFDSPAGSGGALEIEGFIAPAV